MWYSVFNVTCHSQAIDGSTALHSASVVGSVSFIQLLLMNGANPNARDNDGRLPLHWVTASQSVEALELLLKVGITCICTYTIQYM